MGDALAATSLVYDVAKDLYQYYRAWKSCDSDVADLRQQLIWLGNISKVVEVQIQRPGLSVDLGSQLKEALGACTEAAKELQLVLQKVLGDGTPVTALEKLKKHGRKALYPFRKSTIQALAEHVETCRDALQVTINVLALDASALTQGKLQSLDDSLVKGVSDIESALQQLVIKQVEAEILAQEHRQRMAASIEHWESSKKAELVITSLADERLKRRRENINSASTSTLDWIFDISRQSAASQPASGAYDNVDRPQIAENIRNWLAEGTGIMWLSGNPGSGKSTAMKYLSEHDQSRSSLQQWAGSRKLFYASHFFWVAGLPIESSRQGLYQDLLHQVFQACPQNVPKVCSARYDASRTGTWSLSELWNALLAITRLPDTCFCFYIDGLDECQPERDQSHLMNELHQLTTMSSVKILSSSRPWRIFLRTMELTAFTLTMHEINHEDIQGYVRNRIREVVAPAHIPNGVLPTSTHSIAANDQWLKEDHMPPDYDELIRNVVLKADGIFLWVELIMDGLCERIQDGQRPPSLLAHVDALPNTLKDYFKEFIYDRISDTYRYSETVMALHIQCLMDDEEMFQYTDLKLYLYYVLLQGTNQSDPFLLDEDFLSRTKYGIFAAIPIEEINKSASDFIQSCCKGFLAISPNRHGEDVCHFTHRSVFDFLHTDDMQSTIKKHIPRHFQDPLFFLRLIALACKTLPGDDMRWFLRAIVDKVLSPFGDDVSPGIERLRVDIEDVALYKLAQNGNEDDFREEHVLALRLLSVGQVRYVRKLLECRPEAINYQRKMVDDSDLLSTALGFTEEANWERYGAHRSRLECSRPADIASVRLFLERHANPNMKYYVPHQYKLRQDTPSVWSSFVSDIEICHRITPLSHEPVYSIDVHSEPRFQAVGPDIYDVENNDLHQQEHELLVPVLANHSHGWRNEACIEAVVMLIEYGADLAASVLIPALRMGSDGKFRYVLNGWSRMVWHVSVARDILLQRFRGTQHLPRLLAVMERCDTAVYRATLQNYRREATQSWDREYLLDDDLEFLGRKPWEGELHSMDEGGLIQRIDSNV